MSDKAASKEKAAVVNELHRRVLRNFPRRRTIIKGLDDLWQADLAILSSQKSSNRGYCNIILVIDCFSKYIWTAALKTKNGEEVARRMKDILKQAHPRKPINLQTDQGTEFYNSHFQKLMQQYSINHYSTFSIMKAAIAERAIRTLKERLFKYFSLNGTYKWIDILQQITDDYNNSFHRKIGMAPIKVTKRNEAKILKHSFNVIKQIDLPTKMQKGDIVRISKERHMFTKGYLPKWSTELFRITHIKLGNPTTFKLEDLNGDPIKGTFYPEELQKTKQPDVYLVERILKRKGHKSLVKWLGFDNTHNSWVDNREIFS